LNSLDEAVEMLRLRCAALSMTKKTLYPFSHPLNPAYSRTHKVRATSNFSCNPLSYRTYLPLPASPEAVVVEALRWLDARPIQLN
jgi:hypothetical protein